MNSAATLSELPDNMSTIERNEGNGGNGGNEGNEGNKNDKVVNADDELDRETIIQSMICIVPFQMEDQIYMGIAYINKNDPDQKQNDPDQKQNIILVSKQEFRKIFNEIGITPTGAYFIRSTEYSKMFQFDDSSPLTQIFSDVDLVRIKDRKMGMNAMQNLNKEDNEKYNNRYCVMIGSHVLEAYETLQEAEDKAQQLSYLDTYIYHHQTIFSE